MTTQRINASYQEIIDLHTESDKVSILGFHTPANDQPIRLLQPFWEAYQKVRYLGCSMSLVPAARLPADPSQVSYGAGEPPIDPRDLLNPILFHGCHGNDMGSILNQFYSGETSTGGNVDIDRLMSDSMDHNIAAGRVGDDHVYEGLYYRALTDNTWLKAHPQRGFRKSMRPMVYSVAVNTPLNPNQNGQRMGKITNAMGIANEYGAPDDGIRTSSSKDTFGANTSTPANYMLTTGMPGLQESTVTGTNPSILTFSNPYTYTGQHWMTPGIRPLGWIDTRQPSTGSGATNSTSVDPDTPAELMAEVLASNYLINDSTRYCYIPKVFMGLCLLPPAYKTEQYFRIILNHHFAFAKYRGTSMRGAGQLVGVGNVVDMNGVASQNKKGGDDGGDDFKGVLDD